MSSYRDLDIWRIACAVSVQIHEMTLHGLPRFEMYEQGSQIRRSSKSNCSNIVEGYGRRRYKKEFIRFLTFALASCDETASHLELLHETGSLQDQNSYEDLRAKLGELGRKLNRFLQSVEAGHRTPSP